MGSFCQPDSKPATSDNMVGYTICTILSLFNGDVQKKAYNANGTLTSDAPEGWDESQEEVEGEEVEVEETEGERGSWETTESETL